MAEEQCPREQCPNGLGAPQGPLGEVYATHTTIGAYTWRFVVGVQLAVPLDVTPTDVGLGGASGKHVQYAWSDADSFRPAAPLAPFSAAAPLHLHNSTAGICETGTGQIAASTECYPAQWRVVAPVLPNGWVVTGEVGKLMPVSRQRIAALSTRADGVDLHVLGAPGEVVEMGAAAPGAAPLYQRATIGAAGTAAVSFSA